MKTVSIIIPVYNAEAYLEKCLKSILRQSYPALEVLAVDDGSTDGSLAVLEAYARRDPRLHIIHQENRGVSAARNAALDRAAGEYLTFIDADDYIARSYIEAFVHRMEETGADMIVGGLTYVNPDGRVIRKLIPDSYEAGRHEEWVMKISAVAAHFYRRELWEKRPMRFAEGVRGEDMPVALYFRGVCDKIDVLPSGGYAYVQHEGSAMHSFRGLKTWLLPLDALEQALEAVREEKGAGIAQDEWMCLFTLRILATCYFDLARGADRQKKRELGETIYRIMEEYFPAYRKNKLVSLRAQTTFPFAQKAAVWLLVRLIDRHMLDTFSLLM